MTTADQAPVVLWDIDGTLLVAGNGGLEHYHCALSAVVPDITLPCIDTHGKTDWQIILESLDAAGVSRTVASEVSTRLDRNAGTFLDGGRTTLLPHVPEVLRQLHRRGLRNGLLTGNSELRSRYKLAGAGLDPSLIDWDVSFFGSRSPARADLARAARWALPGTRLLIVGDTPFDGIAAAAAGIPFGALCTGMYGPQDFKGIQTVAILGELDEHAANMIACLM